MQHTRKRRAAAQITSEGFDVDHPFLRWYASYWKLGAARCEDRKAPPGASAADLMMGELAASRFSIGVGDDGIPVLGIAEGDADAVLSLNWTGAAFIRRVQRRDWVALSCPDARIDGGGSPGPVALRLWLPTTPGLLDGWVGAKTAPGTIRVIEAAIRKGKPEEKGELRVLPLGFKGNWEAEELAEPTGPSGGAPNAVAMRPQRNEA